MSSEATPSQEASSTQEVKTSIFDKCVEVRVFRDNFVELLKELRNLLGPANPEFDSYLRQVYRQFKQMSRKEFIQSSYEILLAHQEKIGSNSIYLFSRDYHQSPFHLLPHLDIQKVAEAIEQYYNQLHAQLPGDNVGDHSRIDSERQKTYESLFQRLQVLTLLSQRAMEATNHMSEDIVNKRKMLMKMLYGLQVDEEIKSKIDQLDEEQLSSEEDLTKAMDQIKEMMGEHSIVVSLMFEMANEFKGVESGGQKYSDALQTLDLIFGKNGENLEVIVYKMVEKIRAKISKGEITIEDLQKDLNKAKGFIREKVGATPGIAQVVEQVIKQHAPEGTDTNDLVNQVLNHIMSDETAPKPDETAPKPDETAPNTDETTPNTDETTPNTDDADETEVNAVLPSD